MASFWKPEACGQTVLPDKSVLIGQKLVENDKIQKFKCDILSNFQTMWWSASYAQCLKTVLKPQSSKIILTPRALNMYLTFQTSFWNQGF